VSKEELAEALAQQNWDNVLKHGVTLYSEKNCELRDTSRLAVDTALFLLEHPEVSVVSPSLAEIILTHLP
jgi:hypothetical protein